MGFDSEEIVSVEEGSDDIDSSSEEIFKQIPCKRFVCLEENCSASFNRRWRLECHMRKHTGERPFVCLHCDCKKSYRSSSHLKRHVQMVHQPKVDNPLICSYEKCEKKFKTRTTLNRHIKNVHEKRKYVCETCSKPFRKHQHLKIHEYEHTGIKPFPCTYPGCDKSFVVPSKLKRHVKIHAGYKCDAPHCHTKFRTWTLLRRHVNEYHPVTYKCDTCKRTFNKRYNLQDHLKIHAEKKTTFHCPYDNCPRFYYHQRNLRLHIRSFHEDRQFHCNINRCKARFAHKASLKKHIEHHNNNTLSTNKRKQKKPSKRLSKEEKNAKRRLMYKTALPYLGPKPAVFLSGIDVNTLTNEACSQLDLQNKSITATDTRKDYDLTDHHNTTDSPKDNDGTNELAKTNCSVNSPASGCSEHYPEHSFKVEHQQQNMKNVVSNHKQMERIALLSEKSTNTNSSSDCAHQNCRLNSCASDHGQHHPGHEALPTCSKHTEEKIIKNKIIDHSEYTEQNTENKV